MALKIREMNIKKVMAVNVQRPQNQPKSGFTTSILVVGSQRVSQGQYLKMFGTKQPFGICFLP